MWMSESERMLIFIFSTHSLMSKMIFGLEKTPIIVSPKSLISRFTKIIIVMMMEDN